MSGPLPQSLRQADLIAHGRLTAVAAWTPIAAADLAVIAGPAALFAARRVVSTLSIKHHGGAADGPIYLSLVGGPAPAGGPPPDTTGALRIDPGEGLSIPLYGTQFAFYGTDLICYIFGAGTEVTVLAECGEM